MNLDGDIITVRPEVTIDTLQRLQSNRVPDAPQPEGTTYPVAPHVALSAPLSSTVSVFASLNTSSHPAQCSISALGAGKNARTNNIQ